MNHVEELAVNVADDDDRLLYLHHVGLKLCRKLREYCRLTENLGCFLENADNTLLGDEATFKQVLSEKGHVRLGRTIYG